MESGQIFLPLIHLKMKVMGGSDISDEIDTAKIPFFCSTTINVKLLEVILHQNIFL